jgi:nucleoid DNA-binding protein
MTKKDITRKIAPEAGLQQQLALQVVQLVFDGIIETLVTEGREQQTAQLRNRAHRPRRIGPTLA